MQPRLVSTRKTYVFCTDLPVFLVEFGAWETGPSLQLSRPAPVAPREPGGFCPPGVPQGPLGEEVWIAVKTVKVAISMG